MSLAQQIEDYLAIDATGNVSHKCPGLARELLALALTALTPQVSTWPEWEEDLSLLRQLRVESMPLGHHEKALDRIIERLSLPSAFSALNTPDPRVGELIEKVERYQEALITLLDPQFAENWREAYMTNPPKGVPVTRMQEIVAQALNANPPANAT